MKSAPKLIKFHGATYRLSESQPDAADTAAATELKLFIDNDRQLYDQKKLMYKNLAAKVARGVYDPARAIDLFMYLAERAAKSYMQQFGDPHTTWHSMFPTDVRRLVASELAGDFEKDVRQEWDESDLNAMMPKKYQDTPLRERFKRLRGTATDTQQNRS